MRKPKAQLLARAATPRRRGKGWKREELLVSDLTDGIMKSRKPDPGCLEELSCAEIRDCKNASVIKTVKLERRANESWPQRAT